MIVGLPLMKNVLMLLAKNILMQLGLTAAASAAGPTIQTKIYGSGMTMLIILNEEMNDIMKIVKSFEQSGSLIKGVSDTIENEAKKKRWISWHVSGYITCPFISIYVSRERSDIYGICAMSKNTGEGTIQAGLFLM